MVWTGYKLPLRADFGFRRPGNSPYDAFADPAISTHEARNHRG
jgi:hypothetical protein